MHKTNKQRELFFFFTGCLIRVLFLDVTTKVKEMAELCTEYPFFFLQSLPGVSEKQGKMD